MEKKEIIDSLTSEIRQMDFLNITENGKFQYILNYIHINRIKKFIKEFSKVYEDLESFLKTLSFNPDESYYQGCNIYNYVVNNEPYMLTEKTKLRIEDYVNKLKFKEKLENKLQVKNIKIKKEKI